jgi:hypothetical protein
VSDHVQRNLQSGLRVSQVSLAWTIAVGSVAVVVGVIGSSLALFTFGLIGLLDGIGSASPSFTFGIVDATRPSPGATNRSR